MNETAELEALIAQGDTMAEKVGGIHAAVRMFILAGASFGLRKGEHPALMATFLRDMADIVETGTIEPAVVMIHKWAFLGANREREMNAGRKRGVEVRQRTSAQKLAELERAIAQLHEKHPAWTNDDMVDKIMEQSALPYSRSTTAKHVKRIRARLREKPQP